MRIGNIIEVGQRDAEPSDRYWAEFSASMLLEGDLQEHEPEPDVLEAYSFRE